MFKKFTVFGCMALLLLNICGCAVLLAGGAAGAGTAVWLSGKLTQEFHAPYGRTISAAETALKSLGLGIKKQEKEAAVTQFRSEYTDGKEVWVDIRKITEDSTKVEVRVGTVSPDKQAADRILKKIQSYL